MPNGKVVTIPLLVGLIKKYLHIKMNYFPPYGHSIELNLSNYATKSDLQNAAVVATLQFAKKDDFASLKSEVDQLDIDKLEKVSSGLKNLRSKVDKLDANN